MKTTIENTIRYSEPKPAEYDQIEKKVKNELLKYWNNTGRVSFFVEIDGLMPIELTFALREISASINLNGQYSQEEINDNSNRMAGQLIAQQVDSER